jgi:hypothetical protein
MMALKSSLWSAASELEDTSQLSNPENNIDVAIPPKTRPMRRTGKDGKSRRTQVVAYRIQNKRQIRLRPLRQGNESVITSMSGSEYVLRICPDTNERRKHGGAKEAGHKKDGN